MRTFPHEYFNKIRSIYKENIYFFPFMYIRKFLHDRIFRGYFNLSKRFLPLSLIDFRLDLNLNDIINIAVLFKKKGLL
jgi:hypothetical protein